LNQVREFQGQDTSFGRWPEASEMSILAGVLDDDLLNGIIRLLMRIDANVQALLDALTEEDGEDEEPES
jgi:hypothetical protein